MTVVLRSVQSDWIDSLSVQFRAHKRVLGQAVTGFGKTVCFSEISRRTANRGNSVVIVAHRIEIVLQIGRALLRAGVKFGVIAAGHPVSDALVQIGMVQSVANRLDKIPQPNLLVVDEAHHATAGTYQKLVDAWPDSYILGVTASPQRTDGTGLGKLFDALVVGPSMREMISRGYLADYRYLAPPQQMDLSQVATRAGDYALDQLAAAMDKPTITGDAIKHYATHLNGRPAIAFCVSVDHARHVAADFARAGWKAEAVDGTTDQAQRADRIAAIGDGRLNVLASCDLISEGTDIPAVAGALLLRPTQSLVIYLQQVGRVLRLKDDYSKAIILDHVGSVFRHGLPDAVREWTLEGRTKRAGVAAPPVRQCPECYGVSAPSPRCPQCGYVYATAPKQSAIAHKDGALVELTAKDPVKPKVSKDQLKSMIRAAKTFPELKALGEQLGYKPGWANFIHQQRASYRGRRAA